MAIYLPLARQTSVSYLCVCVWCTLYNLHGQSAEGGIVNSTTQYALPIDLLHLLYFLSTQLTLECKWARQSIFVKFVSFYIKDIKSGAAIRFDNVFRCSKKIRINLRKIYTNSAKFLFSQHFGEFSPKNAPMEMLRPTPRDPKINCVFMGPNSVGRRCNFKSLCGGRTSFRGLRWRWRRRHTAQFEIFVWQSKSDQITI